MPPIPATGTPAAGGDYSFASPYSGPPPQFSIPQAIPIDLDLIPLAAVAADDAAAPVAVPLPAKTTTSLSPTSVIDRLDVSGEVGSSGILNSSGIDSSGAVVFSDDLKESAESSNFADRLSTCSSEFDFQSAVSVSNVETISENGEKGLFINRNSDLSNEFAVQETAFNGFKGVKELELRAKKGACHRCLKGSRFSEKECCFACDARYCSGCVLRAMGSMPEGRKCIGCIGAPIMESKREKLGKSSRVLRKLLSSLEVQQVMKAEKNCEANQLRPEDVCVNRKKLSAEEMVFLQSCACPLTKLKPGYYWYDKVSGFWGKEGHKPDKIISPHLNVGGSLMRNASNGNTGVLINGREITKIELQMLKLAGVQCAGNPHFWVNADGTYQEEGQKNIKGQIWGKSIVKLLSPVLSLPIPSKDMNPCDGAKTISTIAVPEYIEQKSLHKLLLVGYDGSGTSTIFNQAKFLYKGFAFSNEERQNIKVMIQSSIYDYLVTLLEAREWFEEELLTEHGKSQLPQSSGEPVLDGINDLTVYTIGSRLKAFSDWLLKTMASGNLEAIFPAASREYAPLVEELWATPAIQATYRRISELHLLPDCASYFLERVVDLSRVEYEPSDRDILCAEGIASLSGLACLGFVFPPLNYIGRNVEVDHQEILERYQLIRVHNKDFGEKCKWLDMFEDVRLAIFCVSLSDYYIYQEDENGLTVNKMMESRRLFETIIRHPAFCHRDFLLILNKFDVLEQKVDMTPLTVCEWFSDFNPVTSRPHTNNKHSSRNLDIDANVSLQAFHYIAVRFKRLFSSITGKKLYVTQTNALNSDSVDSALRYAKEILKWEEERETLNSCESVYSTDLSSFSP